MNKLIVPAPIINGQEEKRLVTIQKKYEKMTEPNAIVKAGRNVATKAGEIVPTAIKNKGADVVEALSASEFYKQAMEYAASGFAELEQLAAKMTVSEKRAIQKINKTTDNYDISTLNAICLVRATDIAKIVYRYKNSNVLLAAAEGAGTGALGFLGLVPNFVASTFLYFRAVQSVAIYYGYDVKNDPAEMEIASSVLLSAFNPGNDAVNNELTAAVGKFGLIVFFSGMNLLFFLVNSNVNISVKHGSNRSISIVK